MSEVVEEASNVYRIQLGQLLKAARERAGLSQQDAAAELRVLDSYIEAMETDRFDLLPGETFVKGYLRAYGRLLKLNGDELVSQYLLATGQDQDTEQGARQKSNRSESAPQDENGTTAGAGRSAPLKPALRWGMVAGMGLLLLATFFFSKESPREPDTASTPVAAVPPADEPVEALITASDILAQSEAPAAGVESPLVESESGKGLSPAMTRLAFQFKSDCWLEITDADGETVHAALVPAGNHLQLEVKTPAQVVLGNALDVSLEVNGQALDLSPYRRGKIARFEVN